jgi:hypothetical protein
MTSKPNNEIAGSHNRSLSHSVSSSLLFRLFVEIVAVEFYRERRYFLAGTLNNEVDSRMTASFKPGCSLIRKCEYYGDISDYAR